MNTQSYVFISIVIFLQPVIVENSFAQDFERRSTHITNLTEVNEERLLLEVQSINNIATISEINILNLTEHPDEINCEFYRCEKVWKGVTNSSGQITALPSYPFEILLISVTDSENNSINEANTTYTNLGIILGWGFKIEATKNGYLPVSCSTGIDDFAYWDTCNLVPFF